MTESASYPDIPLGEPVGYERRGLTVSPGELPELAGRLLGGGFRVALVSGHDDGDRLRATYLFTAPAPDRRVELRVSMDPSAPHVPSLAGLSFPAGRFEREMHDLYGVIPDEHPLPRRLVRHFHWPTGWHPMRRDAGEPPAFGDVDGPYPFRTVEGPGVYEIPVGPVHAGLIEPGHFRFSVVGETILNLKARLWFVHKGLEKLFEGRLPGEGIELAERVSGDTAVGHSLAFCLAVEDALKDGLEDALEDGSGRVGSTALPVSTEARRNRAVLLELERLYNHIGDIGALCNDVGHGILHTQALRIREDLLRINATVTGHRLLRGALRPGATELLRAPDPARLAGIAADIAEVVDLALGHTVVRERFTGTSVLTAAQAADLGTLGYVARASGLEVDARRDHPFVRPMMAMTPQVRTDGDVLARFLVRAAEIQASVEVITELLHRPEDQISVAGQVDRPARRATDAEGGGELGLRPFAGHDLRSGVGIVEGWRGTIVHRIELDPSGRLARVKIVDPSFFNWPALPVALTDTIVPDFPLTNKSFNLSYAGNDL